MSPTIQRARGVTYKTLDASIQEVTGRHIEFIASQETLDRDGDVIECAGIDCADFMRNPILLGDHDKHFILGKITRLWKDRLPDGPALLAKAELLPEGSSARADERYQAIKFGAAKGISIGFLSRAHEPTPTGYRFKAVSLMEISQVSIPSCPTCLITSKSTARHSQKEDRMRYRTHTLQTKDDEDQAFTDMCRRLRQAYEEFSSDKFIQLMAAQLIANPEACAAVTQALQSAGVYAPKGWRDEDWWLEIDDSVPVEFNEADLAPAIAQVIGDAIGTEVRTALNHALGRLD